MKYTVALLLAITALVVADRVILNEENDLIARNPEWERQGEAASDAKVNFRFYLHQRNLDILENEYNLAIDPDSPRYRKWWTEERITELVSPPKQVRQQIVRFLKNHGVHTVVDAGDVIKCTTTVEVVNRLFETSMHTFIDKKSDTVIVRRVGRWSLPRNIQQHIQFTTGLSEFPPPKKSLRVRDMPDENQAGKVVPYVIAMDYGIPADVTVNKNSSICLAEFQNDRSFNADDLKTFQQQNNLPQVPVAKIVGPYQPSVPDAEATLDVQYGSAIAQNASVWFWTVSGWMLEFATDFYGTAQVPYVVSISWGWPEDKQCQITTCSAGQTSQDYVNRCNTEFQKIGFRGVTLLASSGDQGAPGDSNPYCLNQQQPISTIYPGASPYVTSVGATMFQPPSAKKVAPPPICNSYDCAQSTWPETTCSFPDALITTGGGFSMYSPAPSFQASYVKKYLSVAQNLPPSQYFNSTNRGFPDVSALGHNYLIYLGGRWSLVDGTSCSSPVMAGIVALWNDYLLNNKLPVMGPIQNALYKMQADDPTTFKTVAAGNNKCTEISCCTYGFEVSPQAQWNPVVGLGVPNYPKMLAWIQKNA